MENERTIEKKEKRGREVGRQSVSYLERDRDRDTSRHTCRQTSKATDSQTPRNKQIQRLIDTVIRSHGKTEEEEKKQRRRQKKRKRKRANGRHGSQVILINLAFHRPAFSKAVERRGLVSGITVIIASFLFFLFWYCASHDPENKPGDGLPVSFLFHSLLLFFFIFSLFLFIFSYFAFFICFFSLSFYCFSTSPLIYDFTSASFRLFIYLIRLSVN